MQDGVKCPAFFDEWGKILDVEFVFPGKCTLMSFMVRE
jgi:hypothetical protein